MGKPLFIAKQSGHPQGWFGHLVAFVMARETVAANNIALNHLSIQETDHVLEIGFGHGQTVLEIARRFPAVQISGVDPSDVMLSVAHRKCHGHADRLDLQCGAADKLPFESLTFDRAFTVHTTYFWPQLTSGLCEIRRVLRSRGRFVLGFRSADDQSAAASLPKSVYTLHSIAEMKSALLDAGFENISIERTALKDGFMSWAICN